MSQDPRQFPEERIDDLFTFLRALFGPGDETAPPHWIHQEVQLRNHRNSIKMTVQKTAIRQEGLDPVQLGDGEELPAVDSYYDPTTGMLHVDLNVEPVLEDENG